MSQPVCKHKFNSIRSRGLTRCQSAPKGIIPAAPTKSKRTRSLRTSSLKSKRCISLHSSFNNISVNTCFDYSQIQFINEGIIGKGSFSHVYKVTKTTTNKVYALKRSINPSKITHNGNSLSDYSNMTCLTEVAILKKLQSVNNKEFVHMNIVKFRLFFFVNNRLHQIYQLYPYGTLDQLVDNQEIKLNSLQILQILSQIVNGMCYIHSKNIIHCDIKPENIFVEKICQNSNVYYLLKIGDFGISIDLDHPHNQNNKLKLASGDPCYIAPEILNQISGVHVNDGNLQKVDVYSLGIILIELICDIKLPSQDVIFSYLRNIVEKTKIDWNIFWCPKKRLSKINEYQHGNDNIIISMKNELVPRMIQKNAENRISSQQLLILMSQIWNENIQKQSWIEFSKLKLKLPKNISCSKDNNEFSMFCCDKTKINFIPISKRAQMTEFGDDVIMSGDEIISKLTFT
eukprot:182632_1